MAVPTYPLGHKIKMTPTLVLQKALALGVVLSVSGDKLHAAGNREGVAELAPELHAHRAELVQMLQVLPPPNHEPAPDRPALPATTQAPAPTWREADKADQLHYWSCPWCLAVVRTGTGTRCTTGQQLHDTYIEVASRERFIGAKPDPAQPLPKFHVAQPWNEADRAYQAHHWGCTTCKAAARSGGSSQRCATGQHLYATYEQAFEAGKEST